MKKLFALMLIALLALTLLVPALAETADAAADTAEAAVEETEAAAEEAAEVVEEAAEAEAPAPSPIFKKLLEVPWYTWAVLGVLVVAGLLLALNAKKIRWDSRSLSMGAMCIAIAFVLTDESGKKLREDDWVNAFSSFRMDVACPECGETSESVVDIETA